MALEDGVSSAMLEEMRNAFRLIDTNGDGRITVSELEAVMDSLRIEKVADDVERMIHEADIDGNGTVEWEEFYRMMRKYVQNRVVDEDQEYRDAFMVFDHDGNGFIDRHELKSTMYRLGEQLSDKDVDAMISLADTDGDGRINFDEFKEMMRFRAAQATQPSNCEQPKPSASSNGQKHHSVSSKKSSQSQSQSQSQKNHTKSKRAEKT